MTRAQDQLDQATREMVVERALKEAEREQKISDEHEAHKHADNHKLRDEAEKGATEVRNRQRVEREQEERYAEMDKHSESPIKKKQVEKYEPGAKGLAKVATRRAVDYAKQKLAEHDNQPSQPAARKPAPRKTTLRARPPGRELAGWGTAPARGRGSGFLDSQFSFMSGFGSAPSRNQPARSKQPADFGLGFLNQGKPQNRGKPARSMLDSELSAFGGFNKAQPRRQAPSDFGLGFLNNSNKKKGSYLDEMFKFTQPRKGKRGGWF